MSRRPFFDCRPTYTKVEDQSESLPQSPINTGRDATAVRRRDRPGRSQATTRLSAFLTRYIPFVGGSSGANTNGASARSCSRLDTAELLDDDGMELDRRTNDEAYAALMASRNRLTRLFSLTEIAAKLPDIVTTGMGIHRVAVVGDSAFVIIRRVYEVLKVTGWSWENNDETATNRSLAVVPLTMCKQYRFYPDDIQAFNGALYVTCSRRWSNQVRNVLLRCDTEGNIAAKSRVYNREVFTHFDVDFEGNIVVACPVPTAMKSVEIARYPADLRPGPLYKLHYDYEPTRKDAQFIACSRTRNIAFITTRQTPLDSDAATAADGTATPPDYVILAFSVASAGSGQAGGTARRRSLTLEDEAEGHKKVIPYHFRRTQAQQVMVTRNHLYYIDQIAGELCYVTLEDIASRHANCFIAGNYPKSKSFKSGSVSDKGRLVLVDKNDEVHHFRV